MAEDYRTVQAHRLTTLADHKGVKPASLAKKAKHDQRIPAFKHESVWWLLTEDVGSIGLTEDQTGPGVAIVVHVDLLPTKPLVGSPGTASDRAPTQPDSADVDPSAGVELGDDELRSQLEAAEQRNELLRERNRAAAAERDAARERVTRLEKRVAELEEQLAVERAETKRLAQMVALSMQRYTDTESD